MDKGDGCSESIPFKVVDWSRERKFGVVASSLQDFVDKACEKLNMTGPVKVVLELDGTEVDEEEYFNTLECNTCLMVLADSEKWVQQGRHLRIPGDTVDGDRCGGGRDGAVRPLLSRIHGDVAHVSMLGGQELELLSDMDPDSLTDIIPDRSFLDQLKEASGRFLCDKRQAQEALDLLKLYHTATVMQEDIANKNRIAQ
ncbi:DNA fragmentation factor subunit alpha-like [Nilaparvata lugens]|uniref:DNA fragmentation factor subunit alpha n=1 Tax=Nilaparvata lugens TaxID=108931 RepID=UPI000B98A619|nr:DNA fragmentation factor subunit alpha [Nilaparvata lugens]XP_039300906.1 DNA fragmentation factor subunit alpha-like [Nilaparvata lugens]